MLKKVEVSIKKIFFELLNLSNTDRVFVFLIQHYLK